MNDRSTSASTRTTSSTTAPKLVLAAITVAVGLRTYLLVAPGWFFSDDLLNFEIAREMGLSGDYLQRSLFGHLEQGHRFGNWLMVASDADWSVAVILIVGGMMLATILLDAALTLFQVQWQMRAVACGLFGFSLSLTAGQVWWSAALNVVPATIASLFAIICFRLACDRRSAGWAVASAASIAIGVTFYEFVALTAALVVIIEYWPFQRSQDRPPRRVSVAFFVTVGTLQALYWGKFFAGSYRAEAGDVPEIRTFLAFMRWALLRGYGASVLGLSGARADSAFQALLIEFLVIATAIGLVVVLARRYRQWHGPVVGFVAVIVMHCTIVGVARSARDGAGAGLDLRYFADVAWLLPFCLALATRFAKVRPGLAPISRTPRARIATAAALSLVVFVSTRTSADYVANHPIRIAGRYFDKILATQPEAPTSLFDGRLPGELMPPQFAPYNELRRSIAAFLPAGLNVGNDSNASAEILADGAIFSVSMRTIATAAPSCFAPSDQLQQLVVELPVQFVEASERILVLIDAQVSSGELWIHQSSADGSELNQGSLHASSSPLSRNVALIGTDIRSVAVIASPGTTGCTSRLEVVAIQQGVP